MIDQLVGLSFKRGGRSPSEGLDCLTFADYLRRSFQLPGLNLDHPVIAQFYAAHPVPNVIPPDAVLDLAKQLLDRRPHPQQWDLVVVRSHSGETCLGTYLVYDGAPRLLAMYLSGSKAIPWRRISGGMVAGVFDPTNIIIGL